ncbi:MAG: PaaX family transcriptional regulator [Catenulispora sp.]|nr:PaaX family transcriptional regulator [Catenulispora sp.]
MLTFFGIRVLGQPVALFTGSVIDVFARVGVAEQAVRSTLARMVDRGLLERHRQGRKVYFGITEHATAVLQDGYDRVWRIGAVNDDWDGSWTLVGFSLPEAWRRQRHDLRSRLVWGGFGPVQSGLWVAPRSVDVPELVAGLGLDAHLNVFHGTPQAPTEARAVLDTAFDVAAIASRYKVFLEHWDAAARSETDPLARQLLLHTDWLDLIRQDPHLPAEHLPADWPAARAERLFHTVAKECEEPAAAEAARVLDVLPLR